MYALFSLLFHRMYSKLHLKQLEGISEASRRAW